MVTEMISLKLDNKFLEDIDSVVKRGRYHNRTEFIRNALREKVEEAKVKEAMMSIAHLKGASKKKTTDEQLHKIREKAFDELEKRAK
tara:strand:+ start:254 stop:514 length:261 start_codon:yes stop_codon:yes gene_type:complete